MKVKLSAATLVAEHCCSPNYSPDHSIGFR